MNQSLLHHLCARSPVVVTGVGVVSAAGSSVEALWADLQAARSPAVFRKFLLGRQNADVAVCAVPESDAPRPGVRPVRRMDRVVQLAWRAAEQALMQAGLATDRSGVHIGVLAGSSRGPVHKLQEGFEQVSASRYLPSLSADCTFASLTGALAQAFRLNGPSATVSATCASGAYAIALGAEQILLGKADAMLVGGAEAPLVPAVVAQLNATGIFGTDPDPARTCRPFDITRNGLTLGEGSAFLVLESAEAAARRQIPPLAVLSGWGICVDESGRTGASRTGAGLVEAARQAFRVAGLRPADIGYINAHGTGTRINDAAEAMAVVELFGAIETQPPCTSTKAVTGHCLGATPAIESVIAIEALRRQEIPPTANLVQPDPACAIHCQPAPTPRSPLRHVMTNSLGFWGYHSSLIFSKLEGRHE